MMNVPKQSAEPPTRESGFSADDPGALHGRAVADLVRNHSRALHAFLMSRVHDEHEAVEIAQEAFVRMLQLHKPGAVSFLQAYLFKTAANIAIDRVKDRARRSGPPASEAEESLDELTPERRVLGCEDLRVLETAVRELTPKCRDAFVLCRSQNLSTAQIAERLGVQPRMVRNYLARAALYCQLRVRGMSADEARAISG
jgi:RNA polymerase sigma-70 factor (ECF subfamily)